MASRYDADIAKIKSALEEAKYDLSKNRAEQEYVRKNTPEKDYHGPTKAALLYEQQLQQHVDSLQSQLNELLAARAEEKNEARRARHAESDARRTTERAQHKEKRREETVSEPKEVVLYENPDGTWDAEPEPEVETEPYEEYGPEYDVPFEEMEYEEPDYYEEAPRNSYQEAQARNRLAIEREKTLRQQEAARQSRAQQREYQQAQERMQRERLRFQRQTQDRYRRYQLEQAAARAVAESARAGVRGAQVAKAASKQQKLAQAQTGGKRIKPPSETPLWDQIPASTNPAYAFGGGIATGGVLLIKTTGVAWPVTVLAASGVTALALRNSDWREVAIGAVLGSGVVSLIRLLGRGS